jgi:hypothetical protein
MNPGTAVDWLRSDRDRKNRFFGIDFTLGVWLSPSIFMRFYHKLSRRFSVRMHFSGMKGNTGKHRNLRETV